MALWHNKCSYEVPDADCITVLRQTLDFLEPQN